MKSTGIVRRVDDLGRVMIPKEIRRTLKIREGDPLEIFVEDGCVIYKRYADTSVDDDFARLKDSVEDCFYLDKTKILPILQQLEEALKEANR